MPHLNSDLWKVDLHGQLLPAVHVGVVALLEGPLQLVQLVRSERRPVSSVFRHRKKETDMFFKCQTYLAHFSMKSHDFLPVCSYYSERQDK